MKKIISSVLLITGFWTASASASIYDIVCVECSIEGDWEMNDPIGGGVLDFSGAYGDFGFSMFDEPLSAHDVNFYWNSGTYTFDSQGDSVTDAETISMTVGAGQLGMHFLFDWNLNQNVDVLSVFDVAYIGSDMILTATDVDGNGVLGFAMVDGPFQGYDMAVNFTIATPIPAAVWLFGSGLLGLFAVARKKQIK